jgi:Winged helix-turn helix
MRTGITFDVTTAGRVRLETIVAADGTPQKHVWRSKIILISGDGLGTVTIMEATGKSKTCVWRCLERFMTEGVDGLLHDKSREKRLVTGYDKSPHYGGPASTK